MQETNNNKKDCMIYKACQADETGITEASKTFKNPYWEGVSHNSQPPFLIPWMTPWKYSQWYSEPGINSESCLKLNNKKVKKTRKLKKGKFIDLKSFTGVLSKIK